jgi:hypothetical protein
MRGKSCRIGPGCGPEMWKCGEKAAGLILTVARNDELKITGTKQMTGTKTRN